MKILDKIFGDPNEKYLQGVQPIIKEIDSYRDQFHELSETEVKAKTAEFKEQIANGKKLNDILPAAFALVREVASRTLGMSHYDVQMIGGFVLHDGQIAEMRTGEGKTLVATLAVYLNALSDKGVHVITVNDYLAQRDAVWMGQVYGYLGLTVGIIQHEAAFLYNQDYQDSEADQIRDQGIKVVDKFLKPCARKEAYLADITYGTNNEFGFDYLRDNMVLRLEQMVQRPLHYAIVDEVDSILIDEARTPLIISAGAEDSKSEYAQFAQLVKILQVDQDYNIDEKLRAVTLTEDGIMKVEKVLHIDNIYQTKGIATVHHLEQALKAEVLFKKDRDYVVKDGEVIIVDEFTGRMMQGRRYSEGLHQAIEAKEGVAVQRESITLATVTFQNYFRMYEKLAGMTGTALTEAEEFGKIYGLGVVVIPTNQPVQRIDQTDLVYQNEIGKFRAIARAVKEKQDRGQPVLLGTISIEKNEILSELLSREGVKHEILNAKQHDREAEIIAQAGRKGAVTLATNMAGRGVDIVLGGNPCTKEEAQQVKDLGGLHVIGTERHESRRIDNQLRGRSGRQGDPGSTQFFVSLDDDLMRIFGSERMKGLMQTMKVPEEMPIENKIISKSIEGAQKKVEGHNFDTRKHLVEYDDINNKHREVIYRRRKELLSLAENKVSEIVIKEETNDRQIKSLRDYILYLIEQEIEQVVTFHTNQEGSGDQKEIIETVRTIVPLTIDQESSYQKLLDDNTLEPHILRTKLITSIIDHIHDEYDQMVKNYNDKITGETDWSQVELSLLLRAIDNLWIEHLESIDHLRRGIGLRGYGQRDPLVEYKRESYILFSNLLAEIQNQVVYNIFKMGQVVGLGGHNMIDQPLKVQQPSQQAQFTNQQVIKNQAGPAAKVKDEEGHKVGRNDPCPCGSGKKYKKCHGQ
ncbi:MAG: preprotein translocase subunit SecA [Candidatus Komeilibacteria bacterium]